MTLPAWHLEPIAKSHRREGLDCGDPELNLFLRRFARQSHEQNASKTFCAVEDADPGRILGFYTIVTSSLKYDLAPKTMTRGLAKHDIGGFLLARLATDLSVAGQGLGTKLVVSAARRCFRAAQDVGGNLLIIDAKNERAANWYASFGAEPLADHPLTLVILLESLVGDLKTKGLSDANR